MIQLRKKKNRTFFWKEPKICKRGIQLPSPRSLFCDPILVAPHGAYIFSSMYVWLIVVVILVIAIIGGSAIFYMWSKHRKIYAQYKQLRQDIELTDTRVCETIAFDDMLEADTSSTE